MGNYTLRKTKLRRKIIWRRFIIGEIISKNIPEDVYEILEHTDTEKLKFYNYGLLVDCGVLIYLPLDEYEFPFIVEDRLLKIKKESTLNDIKVGDYIIAKGIYKIGDLSEDLLLYKSYLCLN